jgi:large subunit ribosomal protein L13
LTVKTYTATPSTVKHDWLLVDARGKPLGRLASEIARRLRGKHKPEFTPNIDTGDYVVVVNAAEVKVTGKKANDKIYYRHSNYPGGIKATTFAKLIQSKPERVIELAVKGMLPKGSLGRALFRKLKVYAGPDHKHAAQQPRSLEI